MTFNDGDVSRLHSIPMDAIQAVTFLHPSEAWMRFGITCRCADGALLIDTCGRRRFSREKRTACPGLLRSVTQSFYRCPELARSGLWRERGNWSCVAA